MDKPMYAFTANSEGLPFCLICGSEFCNKKSNIERYCVEKRVPFGEKNSIRTTRNKHWKNENITLSRESISLTAG